MDLRVTVGRPVDTTAASASNSTSNSGSARPAS
jgi:hypothetical protein